MSICIYISLSLSIYIYIYITYLGELHLARNPEAAPVARPYYCYYFYYSYYY